MRCSIRWFICRLRGAERGQCVACVPAASAMTACLLKARVSRGSDMAGPSLLRGWVVLDPWRPGRSEHGCMWRRLYVPSTPWSDGRGRRAGGCPVAAAWPPRGRRPIPRRSPALRGSGRRANAALRDCHHRMPTLLYVAQQRSRGDVQRYAQGCRWARWRPLMASSAMR